ncbi:Ubiquitin-conjugating enzyme E2-18 kDa [Termitomyces sp. J132]|nr:Ubiquitin-conjugating enzyme E2-18 kDa [Termitomyces sp. J132]
MAGRSSTSATALRRLMAEYKQLTSGVKKKLKPIPIPQPDIRILAGSSDGMFTGGPISESDFFTWEALICGPKDTLYESPFSSLPQQPSDYPLFPFKMKFEPHLFHPSKPNLESGANIDCCKLYRENRAGHEGIVRKSIREQLGL